MYRRRYFLIATSLFAVAHPLAARADSPPEPVTLRAADGTAVYGLRWRTGTARRGTILLFHQAGTNAAEYGPIGPRLAGLGFDALAIDQRSGGTAYGRRNETAARIGGEVSFVAALPDLEAALAFARADKAAGPVIVWGSSYSAALAFVLAAKHRGEVAAVLAFSPGEYLDRTSVRDAAARVDCPVFVTSASSADEEAAAQRILDAVPSALKRQYRPKIGVHGSATLRVDRDPSGAEANWQAVIAFLDDAVPAARR
jgi:dienelactone hydrolase